MKICIGLLALTFTLAACTAPPPSLPRQPDANALPSRTNTVHLPNGHTLQCTAYPGAVCPQS
jgi:starvation-inducible outer membrane lipoprotein